MTNLTLSVDETILKKARKRAIEKNKHRGADYRRGRTDRLSHFIF